MKNLNIPLSEKEIEKMESYLSKFPKENICNVEMLDGFLAAIVCTPDMVMPSEYLEAIWGKDTEVCFETTEEAQNFLDLVMRHYNTISRTLNSEEIFVPLLWENEEGEFLGNDWATGFIKGTHLRMYSWAELIDDEENGGIMVPIFSLCYENDPDPEMRPWKDPPNKEKREFLIGAMAGCVMKIYKYFKPHRQAMSRTQNQTIRNAGPKIGRNEPCPCGSGKKYKFCCINVSGTIH